LARALIGKEDGDVVEVEIENVGLLRNIIKDEAKA